MRARFAVLSLVVAGLVLSAGCATRVSGAPLAGVLATSTTSTPPEPAADVVTWANNFCAVANYLTSAGSLTVPAPTATDPAGMRLEMSANLGRVVGVLDVALHDLSTLVPGPVDGTDVVVRVVSEPLDEARSAFASAKSTIDAANPLTTEAIESAVGDQTRAVTAMQEGVSAYGTLTMPEEVRAAVPSAPNCNTTTPPSTTR
ncbi:hypothetical protein [Umezawaea beigongshangensis]|uniref:hypothetical protein n=1 Tax=Umezawaea beigongshangensis TaxID=2780383 RepID=UPI0018F15C89|nr:hypothetical protein [Umezawaea beigongshangensis]